MATNPLYIILASPECEAVAAVSGYPVNVCVSMGTSLVCQNGLNMEERYQGRKLISSMLEQNVSDALKQLNYTCLGDC